LHTLVVRENIPQVLKIENVTGITLYDLA
jgi:hypothetical protein